MFPDHRTHPRRRRRGVSLIEALVALAVMAFGMLSLVGVQATMRLNSDLSKQRGEATRIAAEELENLRLFTSVQDANGQVSWDGIADRVVAAYVPPDNTGNTSYRVERRVSTVAGTPQKLVSVQVLWTDRSGKPQSVTVDTVLVGAAPVLSSLLSVPAQPSPFSMPGGRNPTIPPEAVDLDGGGSGSSAFKPFDRGTVAWIFNNYTGVITSVCTNVTAAQAVIVTGNLVACTAVNGRLVSGKVKFDQGTLPDGVSLRGQVLPLPVNAPLLFPTTSFSPVSHKAGSPASCVAGPPSGLAVPYNCLVFPADNSGWGGKLDVASVEANSPNGDPLPPGVTAGPQTVCRYTGGSTEFTSNDRHPKSYCMVQGGPATAALPCGSGGSKVTVNLANQDFLVISSGQSCPVGPITGNWTPTYLLPHQP
jgi:Tfp pilus assembly protein PilV